MSYRSRLLFAVVAGTDLFLIPTEALAYGGPGSVISGIGALLAAVAAVAAAIFGFFWFPIKRLVKRIREDDETQAGSEAEEA